MRTLAQIPDIRRTLKHITETDILVFSIGRADVMAERRHLNENLKKRFLIAMQSVKLLVITSIKMEMWCTDLAQ